MSNRSQSTASSTRGNESLLKTNVLYYGDNLDILRNRIDHGSVDLVYLDPPFNSNRSYNVLFGRHQAPGDAQAQIGAFDDTWTWMPETDRLYFDIISGGAPPRVADALRAMHGLLGEGDLLAYLVMMAARLVELRRVLKDAGSIYLHCDPTASHYLKVLMDAVFEPANFRNEIIWRRTPFAGSSKARARQFPRSHDVLLFYGRGDARTWNQPTNPYSPEYLERFKWDDHDGRGPYRKTLLKTYSQATFERLEADNRLIEPQRHGAKPSYKQYLSESSGTTQVDDIWTDINALNPMARERLGYPTQKPEALLERIIKTSSDEGDVVLDPFCGCGTSVIAAQKLHRRWIGIDIAYIAVDLVRRRLEDALGSEAVFEIDGIPRDISGAEALFAKSPFDFERWAVSLVYGQPNEKQVADKGTDGVIRFPISKNDIGRVLVSVKGGHQVNPSFVRDLKGTLTREKAEMGVLITLVEPTRGMVDEARHSGNYVWPVNGGTFPKVQLVTIKDLLGEHRLEMPPPLSPYLTATRHTPPMDQLSLGS